MRTLRLSIAGTVVLMLLGGLSGVVLAQDEAGESHPATEATVEVLSDVGVIPLEAIPEDADHVTYARISAEPGVSGQVGSAQPQEWANLEYTQSGTISSTWDIPVRVWQLDGSVVDYPAGTPQKAHAGEVALFHNGGAAVVFENTGPDEAVSFFVGVGNSRDQETPQVGPPGTEWRILDFVFPYPTLAEAWFSAPIAVSYERITWEPGAQLVLGTDEVPMLSFIWLESGELKYREMPADEASRADINFTLWTGDTWTGRTPADGHVHVLRNEGDVPAVGTGVTLSHVSKA